MEPPSKKEKLSTLDESSMLMDPFDHLFDVHQLIYQHLSGSDVKTASLVSKKWNENIGNSQDCMSKIRLSFICVSSTNPSPAEVTAILKSQRRYSSINFKNYCRTNINRRSQVLSSFADSVVALNVDIDTKIGIKSTSFPKLTSLELVGVNSSDAGDVIEFLQNIEFEKIIITADVTPAVVNFVMAQRRLKDLRLFSSPIVVIISCQCYQSSSVVFYQRRNAHNSAEASKLKISRFG